MQGKLCKLCNKFQILILREEGQDLIEYALLVAVIGFATTAGMLSMAAGVNTIFTTIGTALSTATG